MRAPVDRRIDAAPGVALRVLDWGPGTGVPVLCIHGLASNARTWEGVAGRLCDLGHPVAAVDLRGHGHSDKADSGYDFATMGSDLEAVLDDLGWRRAVLAGQSTGGNLVVRVGACAPERVAGVAGVDGGAFDLQRRWPEWEDCREALAPPPLAGTPLVDIEGSVRRSHPDWSDWGVAATLANFEVLPDGTIRPWLTFERHLLVLRALWEHRPAADVARISAPVLLMVADTDDDWSGPKRDDVEAARAARPSIVVQWFPGADHDLHIQHPVAVADLLHDTFI
jgi:pimeloyl-ACP methyl ester carboxylesterase